MDITKLSDAGLLSLYNAITSALEEDDAQPSDDMRTHGVRMWPDWRAWGDALESEIKRRDLAYRPIPW